MEKKTRKHENLRNFVNVTTEGITAEKTSCENLNLDH
jgi:hypothetical protein